MSFLEDMILCVCVLRGARGEARVSRRGRSERGRDRERDEKTSWMNEFGEFPPKRRTRRRRKRKMGKEETRSAVMERGATALTIRGRALPVWAGAGSGDKGVGGTGGLGKATCN